MATNDTNAADIFLMGGREDLPFLQAAGTNAGRLPEDPAVWMAEAMRAPWMLLTAFAALPFAVLSLTALLPLVMTWNLSESVKKAAADAASKPAAGADPPAGFKVGSIEIPQKLLSKLLKMEMSPDNLAKLQRALDFTFSLLP